MDPSIMLAVIGIVVSIIGIGVAIAYGRRVVRQRLYWELADTALLSLAGIPEAADIEITALKQPVTNPYLCTFTVGNPDRQDIDSRVFDQGRPVRFMITGCRVIGFVGSADGTSPLHGEGESI